MFAAWVNRHQLDVIDYLQEENRVLKERLGGRRIRFTDAERRLGRPRIMQTIVDLILRMALENRSLPEAPDYVRIRGCAALPQSRGCPRPALEVGGP
jgi:hypothetical protein